MPRHAVDTSADAARIWALIARPDQWSRWSPHVRGAEGLGSPEVLQGARGSVVLMGGVRLAAEITDVTPGRSWSWRVRGLDIHHLVEPCDGGSRLTFAVQASRRRWMPAAVAYAPLVALIARRIARIAESEPA